MQKLPGGASHLRSNFFLQKLPGGASNYGRTSTSTSTQTVVMPVLASPHIIHPKPVCKRHMHPSASRYTFVTQHFSNTCIFWEIGPLLLEARGCVHVS